MTQQVAPLVVLLRLLPPRLLHRLRLHPAQRLLRLPLRLPR